MMRTATFMILLFLSAGMSLRAQPADSSARDIVLEAFAALDATSYRFTQRTHIVNSTDVDGWLVTIYSNVQTEAQAASNGDFSEATTISGGSSPLLAAIVLGWQHEARRIDDVLYVNVQINHYPFEGADILRGWWRYDDLIEQIDNPARALLETNIPAMRLPGVPVTDETLLDAVEVSSETIDSVDYRVFDLKLDAWAVARVAQPAVDQPSPEQAESTESDLSMRVWLGPDNLLHWVEGASLIDVPRGVISEDVGYRTESTFTTEISGHGEPITIEAPELAS